MRRSVITFTLMGLTALLVLSGCVTLEPSSGPLGTWVTVHLNPEDPVPGTSCFGVFLSVGFDVRDQYAFGSGEPLLFPIREDFFSPGENVLVDAFPGKNFFGWCIPLQYYLPGIFHITEGNG